MFDDKNDSYFMDLAIKEASLAFKDGEVPIGAVVVCGGQVIASGRNRRSIDKNPLAHAEIMAIQSAATVLQNWRLDHCTLYVTLEPCAMCAGVITQARVGAVVYGGRDPKAGGGGSLYNILDDPRATHRCMVRSGVLKNECLALLRDYFRSKRRKRDASNGKRRE